MLFRSNIADMKLYCENSSGVVTLLASSGGASGDVVGPASATDNAIVRFDGTTGKLVQNSGVTIDDSGNMVVSVNSATDALRITQTGAGNALLVEDSANPDSTPFVVDASGRVLVGHTAVTTLTGGTNPFVQVNGTGAGSSYSATRWENTANQPFIFLNKSRSSTVGTFGTIVQSGDALGSINFNGDDGTSTPVQAAGITAQVDGTPGTNDMPGRLVFSTTADGASSVTERMRIDSAGNVGIGAAATTGITLDITKAQTGATTAYTVAARINPDSTVTTAGYGFSTYAINGVGASTPTIYHFSASQGTYSGTAPTNQYGFVAQSALTGATNNYGFFSDIASGTGRWNFYANGTAANYFGGNTIINGAVGVGSAGSDRKSTRLNSSHTDISRMPSSA